jgi:hypothetical protein
MTHLIVRFDHIFLLLGGYLLFIFTVITNGWFFIVGNNSIGFQAGCVFSCLLAAFAIIRVFARPTTKILRATVGFISLPLLCAILFWIKVTSG